MRVPNRTNSPLMRTPPALRPRAQTKQMRPQAGPTTRSLKPVRAGSLPIHHRHHQDVTAKFHSRGHRKPFRLLGPSGHAIGHGLEIVEAGRREAGKYLFLFGVAAWDVLLDWYFRIQKVIPVRFVLHSYRIARTIRQRVT